ncbi:GNAT family N-acetyltransferase [Furfurilactobacillus siliginis]|uniref:Acetyltransferase n=1 Tax=Furfurilactobacillus siliginis TaxID=348151 RepID=A0A0R2L3T5_9LACO|nr:GNAT family N-acetyltransferase [Furfurilactobacillus siliginis]KRN96457.1 acetyltransferase [Furfurilactobacillus siliginis]GEK28911.1 GNAT family acetyltransferase [Furfurilactobacillus siliginis]
MWQLKQFSELTADELFDIMKARIDVFVVEQKRIYPEADELDRTALHLFNYVDHQLVAYARIFPKGDYVTFGRVLTTSAVRGSGYGAQLVTEILQIIQQRFPNRPIQIDAQTHAQEFYQRFGFTPVGDIFTFNHTPHIRMDHNAL